MAAKLRPRVMLPRPVSSVGSRTPKPAADSFSGLLAIGLPPLSMSLPGRLLPKECDADHDEHQQCQRRGIAAQSEPARSDGFVEKVADYGAEWASQNKGCPEQRCARDIRPEVRRCDGCQQRGEDHRRARVTKPCSICCPV